MENKAIILAYVCGALSVFCWALWLVAKSNTPPSSEAKRAGGERSEKEIPFRAQIGEHVKQAADSFLAG